MERLKHGFTTLIGTVIILCTLLFIYNDKTTVTEASGFLSIGVALIFSRDDYFNKNFLPFLIDKKTEQPTP